MKMTMVNLGLKGLTFTTLKIVCINHGEQRVFSIRNHHKCLTWLFRFHLNTNVIGLRPLKLFSSVSEGIDFDVYRHQILKSVPTLKWINC